LIISVGRRFDLRKDDDLKYIMTGFIHLISKNTLFYADYNNKKKTNEDGAHIKPEYMRNVHRFLTKILKEMSR